MVILVTFFGLILTASVSGEDAIVDTELLCVAQDMEDLEALREVEGADEANFQSTTNAAFKGSYAVANKTTNKTSKGDMEPMASKTTVEEYVEDDDPMPIGSPISIGKRTGQHAGERVARLTEGDFSHKERTPVKPVVTDAANTATSKIDPSKGPIELPTEPVKPLELAPQEQVQLRQDDVSGVQDLWKGVQLSQFKPKAKLSQLKKPIARHEDSVDELRVKKPIARHEDSVDELRAKDRKLYCQSLISEWQRVNRNIKFWSDLVTDDTSTKELKSIDKKLKTLRKSLKDVEQQLGRCSVNLQALGPGEDLYSDITTSESVGDRYRSLHDQKEYLKGALQRELKSPGGERGKVRNIKKKLKETKGEKALMNLQTLSDKSRSNFYAPAPKADLSVSEDDSQEQESNVRQQVNYDTIAPRVAESMVEPVPFSDQEVQQELWKCSRSNSVRSSAEDADHVRAISAGWKSVAV